MAKLRFRTLDFHDRVGEARENPREQQGSHGVTRACHRAGPAANTTALGPLRPLGPLMVFLKRADQRRRRGMFASKGQLCSFGGGTRAASGAKSVADSTL